MYITKAQLEARLKGQSNGNGVTVKRIEVTREKSNNLSRETKVLVGALAKIDTRKNIEREFGVDQSTISLVARGLTGNRFDADLKRDIDKTAAPLKADISNRALDVLMNSLGVVESKVGATKAVDASMIAKNMAIVHEKMSPRQDGPRGSNILIQINAPRQRSEKEYESVEVTSL